jgi:tetratricopeptide (TPR) repeat protein
MKKIALIIGCCFFMLNLNAQTAHEHLLEGNEHYLNDDYASAELNYRKSLEKEQSLKAEYNLGGAVYKQKRFDEAIEHFQASANAAKTDLEKGSAYHNLGNSYLNAGKVKESIEAYKNALKYIPDDKGSMYNLAMAQQLKRQQQQQQQQQQDQNQDQQDSEEDQENQDQQQQQSGDEEQDEKEQNQDQQEDQEQNSQEEQNVSSGDKEEMSKDELNLEDALKLLQAIDNEDQKVQEKMRKKAGTKKKPDKDW